MSIEFKPHKYQELAITHALENKKCGLFLEMGLGKTVSTLTVIDELIYNRLEIQRVLVIAPLRVAWDTWSREAEKWAHTKHLRISKVLGSVKERRKALIKEADIYIINRENVIWLTNELSSFGDGWLFDMVIIDELSSFKSHSSKRFKALKKFIIKSERVIGLTGTPSPNGLLDLWSQLYLLDGGERLGKTITAYRDRYFLPDKRNGTTIFSYKAKEETETAVKRAIGDICISMTASDWLELPDRIDNVINVCLSDIERKNYEKLEREAYFNFAEGEVSALTKGVLINKLRQYCNGSVYLDDGGATEVSDKKLDALEEIIETANGKPVLVFYAFKTDKMRLISRFNNAEVLNDSETIKRWNEGKISILVTHPASAGHGLNLQDGGSIIIWYGIPWSLELYQQANARLHRQGQKESVIVHHLLVADTIEQRVFATLQQKEEVQNSLIEYLKVKYERGK